MQVIDTNSILEQFCSYDVAEFSQLSSFFF